MDTGAHPEDVTRFSQCPVPDKQRRRTDIFCTICPALFALILFIVACAAFNNNNLKQMTYFLDAEANVCGYDEKVQNYALVYFTSLNDPAKRLCVSKCPKAGDKSLDCYPIEKLACSANSNPNFEVQIYDSQIQINRIGGICMPTDPTLAQKIKQISHLQSKYTFLTIYDAIWDAMWISAIFGVALIVLLQLLPRKTVHWIFILGSLTFIALGITIFIVPQGFVLYKIIGGSIFLFMGFLAGYSVIKQEYRKEIFICGRLFQIAAQIVSENWWILGTILIWLFLECGLIALASFQMLSAWSIGPLTFEPESPFLRVTAFISGFLSFFIFLQFFWGLSFLKQSFNFVISGYATQWYCHRRQQRQKIKLSTSFLRFVKYHWGSVAGGSLLLCIFYFVDLFIDFFSSSDTSLPPELDSKLHVQPFKREVLERRGVRGLFDLVRSESFGYINMMSIPYCNASRYCEMMADDSRFYDRSQTTNRLYRLCAHITIMMIATLIALSSNKYTDNKPGVVGVFFVALVCLFTVTYFISLHGDLAEGLLIAVFLEERLNQMDPTFEHEHGVEGGQSHTVLIRPPENVRDLHEDDIAGAYDQSTIWQYLKGHIQHRRDASRGNVGGEKAVADRF